MTVTLKNGQTHRLYVSDITEVEEEMKELFPSYNEDEVKRENIIFNLRDTCCPVRSGGHDNNGHNEFTERGCFRRRKDAKLRKEQGPYGGSGAD